jgi:undecaprenyl diphosphate synthase
VVEGVAPEDVTEEALAARLGTRDMPDPDLVIRTSGEMRLSNFLIWQTAYSEFYTTPVYWPDFDEAEIERALGAYASRGRRFGGYQDVTHNSASTNGAAAHNGAPAAV